MAVDYYNTLKLNRTATEDDMKRAYKRLAMKWHPDKNPANKTESEAKFKQISEAYDVLTDPQKRQIYDLYGEEGLQSFDLGNAQTPGNGDAAFQYNPRDAEDIFAEFFEGSGLPRNGRSNNYSNYNSKKKEEMGNQKSKKAASIESKLSCSLEDLYRGARRKMRISRSIPDDFGFVFYCITFLITLFEGFVHNFECIWQ